MSKSILLLMACMFSLSGCATFDNDECYMPMLPSPKAGKYLIQLNLVNTPEEVKEKCGIDYAKACAIVETYFNTSTLTKIYADRNNFDCYMSHEVRHATNGRWHGDW